MVKELIDGTAGTASEPTVPVTETQPQADATSSPSGQASPQPRLAVALILTLGSAISLSGVVLTYVHGTVGGLMLLAAGIALIVLGVRITLPSSFDRYAEQIRDRVETTGRQQLNVSIEPGAHATIVGHELDPATSRASDALSMQEAILREIYTQGLAQAKVSFRISIVFAGIGASILVLGAAIAIYRAPVDGDKYAPIITAMAGVIINLTSAVFFVQSNKARRSMGEQGVMLREEGQEDRRLSAARELAATIEDASLRDDIRAKLALKLLGLRDSEGATTEEENRSRNGAI